MRRFRLSINRSQEEMRYSQLKRGCTQLRMKSLKHVMERFEERGTERLRGKGTEGQGGR